MRISKPSHLCPFIPHSIFYNGEGTGCCISGVLNILFSGNPIRINLTKTEFVVRIQLIKLHNDRLRIVFLSCFIVIWFVLFTNNFPIQIIKPIFDDCVINQVVFTDSFHTINVHHPFKVNILLRCGIRTELGFCLLLIRFRPSPRKIGLVVFTCLSNILQCEVTSPPSTNFPPIPFTVWIRSIVCLNQRSIRIKASPSVFFITIQIRSIIFTNTRNTFTLLNKITKRFTFGDWKFYLNVPFR